MNILLQFTHYTQQIGYGKSTQYQLNSCITEFLEVTQKSIENIERQDILDFYEYLQTRPLKKRTGVLSQAMIQHYISALKTFFEWLEQQHHLQENPISNIRFKRPERTTREPLSQQEVAQLFRAAQTIKETALLHLFYSCGLRRTEAENLNISDLHFSKNLVYVRQGKGAKRRVIPITEKVKKHLENYYIKERTAINKQTTLRQNKEAYMLGATNQRMSGDGYNRALKNILKRTEIQQKITLHHLRHSIATHLLENGLSVEFVRDFLGHSHLETTQIYAKVKAYQLKNL